MRIEALKRERLEDFIQYCIKHRDNLDDSFLSDEELKRFALNDENPTYVLLDDEERIKGTASLYKSEYYRRGNKARFRILHSEMKDIEIYRELLEKALKHVNEVERVVVFNIEQNEELHHILLKLGFIVERYAFDLDRENLSVAEWSFPEDYELRTFKPGRDEGDWCKVRNTAFSTHLGSETPVTPEMLVAYASREENLNGGMMMLYHKLEPVGILIVQKEFKNREVYTQIELLGLVPGYQGKGLGTNLLRAGISFGQSQGMSKATITVNAENKKAADLYLSEGFYKARVYIGYYYDLHTKQIYMK